MTDDSSRSVAAGEAILIACRNYSDSETLADALHVATGDLHSAAAGSHCNRLWGDDGD